MRQRIVLWAFIIAALGLVTWAGMSYADPAPQCRGVAMAPGDTCHYSSLTEVETSRVQTYDERVATARTQLPFVMGVGALAAGFGVWLLVRSGKQGHGAEDHAAVLD